MLIYPYWPYWCNCICFLRGASWASLLMGCCCSSPWAVLWHQAVTVEFL